MKGKSILLKHCNSCHRAQELAKLIYDDLVRSNYSDNDLIEVYREMTTKGLSTFELEKLTRKRLVCLEKGYILRDIADEDVVQATFNMMKDLQ